jgi:hypothetical protein
VTFHLKRNVPLKRSRFVARKGRRTKEWERVRRQLKCEFTARGIQTCELRLPDCMVDNGLGFAHGYKRRHITTVAEPGRVILACNNCHDHIERQGEAAMSRIVDSVIAGRR